MESEKATMKTEMIGDALDDALDHDSDAEDEMVQQVSYYFVTTHTHTHSPLYFCFVACFPHKAKSQHTKKKKQTNKQTSNKIKQ